MAGAGDRLTVGELAAAVVAQDEEVRDDLKALVRDMIRHMRWTMRHGEPSAKTALSKQIIPQLLTAINKVDQNEHEAEERAAYERLMRAMAGDAPTTEPADTTPETTVDAAPVAKKAAPRKKVAAK